MKRWILRARSIYNVSKEEHRYCSGNHRNTFGSNTHSQPVGESWVEWRGGLNLLEVSVSQRNGERLDIGRQVLYFAPPDDGEHESRFLHHVGDSH